MMLFRRKKSWYDRTMPSPTHEEFYLSHVGVLPNFPFYIPSRSTTLLAASSDDAKHPSAPAHIVTTVP